ncbi:8-oxo-dGTP pyrophosphatase MutT (NUDIX family) [Streptomyces nodosus]|nr:8-oxo-dGTP pyrophosphatase MutT (NUDIX family) [Streptomyces nodosus]
MSDQETAPRDEPSPDLAASPEARRHTEPLDVHLILRRDTGDGPEVLLSRRAGAVYAAGLWHLPSGHLDGPHEDVVAALVREALEETGVVIDPADVRAAVTVHHRSPGGLSRTGFFCEVRRWKGDPRIAEPDVCDALDWVRPDALPDGMVAYCRAGLDAYAAGARLAVHFQLPGDAIAYDPGADRLRIVPDMDGPAAGGRPSAPGFGVVQDHREVVERGRRAPARLRAEHPVRPGPRADAGAPPFPRAFGCAGGPAPLRTPRPEETAAGERPGGRGWLPPEEYAETVLKATAFACVYFTDEDDRPLQLRSVYSPTHPWQLVGGTMDPGERPWETAVRECREETGLTPAGPPRLLATVYGLPGAEWPYSTVGLVFDGGRLTMEQLRGIALDPDEHDEARVLPLREWEPLMPPRDFARLSAVARARRTGVAAYFDTWDWGDD